MSDFSTASVGPFLSTLRTLPVWMLGGLALTGYPSRPARRFIGARHSGIEADIPAGTPDNLVRTVTENSRTLKFSGNSGFETE